MMQTAHSSPTSSRTRRRDFLRTSATVAAATLCGSTSRADEVESLRVDTHLHCFAGRTDERFPYHQRAPYRPTEAATPEQLLQCMDGAGVKFAVVVHPEPYQDDHRYLEHCLHVGRGRLKGTALVFADQPASLRKLPRLAARMDLVAARVHAYAPKRLPPFGKPELRELWKIATDAGLAMQLHFEPRYAAGFEPLLREFRETTVIIDHLGRPFQGTPQEHARIIKWADYPNTVMKLSSIPSTRNYPHRDIRPVIRQLTDAYGADRMIYGGGFGADATPESYRQAFQRARTFIDHLPAGDQAKILGGTAARIMRFN